MPIRSMLSFYKIDLNRIILVFIFLLIGFSWKADAQNVQVDARLDRVSIPIGGQTLLHLSAKMPLKTAITFRSWRIVSAKCSW